MDTTIAKNEITPTELTYAELHYIPVSQKDELWMAKNIVFAKLRCNPLVDPEIAKQKRTIDRGGINEGNYKRLFDPQDGKAEFIAADWRSNPLYIHLNNIQESRLKKIPTNLTIKAVDEYAKLKQQKENSRIIKRREFMSFLNDINKQLGFPPLSDTDDPYKYSKQMMQGGMQDNSKRMGNVITPDGVVDSIKSAIYDNEDLALYNEFIYKGDIEIVMEMGIDHYLKANKFKRVFARVVKDLRNFNRCCMRWYTSLSNGKPVIEYLDPSLVHTFEFQEQDGNDNVGWFVEYDVTYGEFMRMFGAALEPDALIDIFERNRLSTAGSAGHGLHYNMCTISQRMSARIRIGYIEVESQNRAVFTEGNMYGNLHFKERDEAWQEKPNTRKKFRKERKERNYNVWYRAYYIPPDIGVGTAYVHNDTITNQAKYIFDMELLQDMQRYGDENRWAKSSLIVWKEDGMSYSDIMERYMPKINFLWLDVQNDLAQNVDGIVWSDEMIKSMILVSDESATDEKELKKKMLQRLKQTGQGVGKMTDADGKAVEPFKKFRSGHLESAADKLIMIQNLYSQMTQALATSQTGEGQDPRPRTSVQGLKLSWQAQSDANFFLEDAAIDLTEELGERLVTYIKKISEEGDTQRFRDFKDIVGQANGLMMEEIKDIPLHKFGISVHNINNDEMKQYVQSLAEKLVAANALDIEVLSLLLKVDNWKYAAVLMIMKYKSKKREETAEIMRREQAAQSLKETELQVELLKYKGKEDAKRISIDAQMQADAKLIELESQMKALTQSMLQDQRGNNRVQQDNNKYQLEKQKLDDEAARDNNYGVQPVQPIESQPVVNTSQQPLFAGPVMTAPEVPNPVGAPPTNPPVPEQGMI